MANPETVQRLIRVMEGAGVPSRDAAFLQSGLDEVASYATEAELVADTTPPDGSIAFAQDTGWFFFKRGSTWQSAPNAANATVDESTSGNMNIPIATNGYDGPAPNEVVFHNQSEVDAYLTSKGATALKYMTKVWDYAIPQYVRHTVRFYLGAGVHRPENPLPAAAQAAWDFCRIDLPPHTFLESGYLSFAMGPNTTNYYAGWEKVPGFTGDYVCTAHSGSGSADGVTPPSITCAGENFGTENGLVGYYAVAQNNATPRPIVGNTGDTIYVARSIGTMPDTIRILSPSSIMRNSYDDVTKVKPIMVKVDLLASDSGQPRVNFDSVRLDQMGAATGVAVRDSLLDMFAVLFDHARQKNDFGVTETFGNCATLIATTGRAHVGGQFWSTCMRGNTYASTPGSGLTAPILFEAAHARDKSSMLSLILGVVGGFNTPATFKRGALALGSFRFLDQSVATPTTYLTLEDMYVRFTVNQKPISGFVRCSGGVAFYGCEIAGNATYNALMFEGQPHNNTMLAFFYDNKTVEGPLRVLQGLTANAGRAVALVGPRNDIQFSPACDLVGAGGNIDISDSDYTMGLVARSYTWAELDALRAANTQPGGTLLGAVEVVGVDAGSPKGIGAQLQFTFTGTLLTYKAYGEFAYGPAINIGAGGIFTLQANSGYCIQVKVERMKLPNSDSLQTFEVSRGFVDWRWTQNRVSRRYA